MSMCEIVSMGSGSLRLIFIDGYPVFTRYHISYSVGVYIFFCLNELSYIGVHRHAQSRCLLGCLW